MDAETLDGLASDCARYSMATIERTIQTFTTCPQPMEFLGALEAMARTVEMERIATGYDMETSVPLGECGCDGTGYTTIREAGADGPEVVRPCDVCLPTAFKMWAGGHFGGHRDCAECRGVRGQRKRRQPSRV
jgi:hypothetical protein